MSWEDIKNAIIHGMEITSIYSDKGIYVIKITDPDNINGPLGRPFKVKVREGADGRFTAKINYMLLSPGQANPYISMDSQDNVEKAIRDALNGLLMVLPKDSEERSKTARIPVEDW